MDNPQLTTLQDFESSAQPWTGKSVYAKTACSQCRKRKVRCQFDEQEINDQFQKACKQCASLGKECKWPLEDGRRDGMIPPVSDIAEPNTSESLSFPIRATTRRTELTDAAVKVRDAFREALTLLPEIDERSPELSIGVDLNGNFEQFRVWARNTGAFASSEASLDYRLKDHAPLGEFVARTLRGIASDLSLCRFPDPTLDITRLSSQARSWS